MKRVLQLLERAFRHALVYPLLRLVFRRRAVTLPMDLSRVRKLLILRHDRIGDMIVTTPIFRELKRLRPELHIGVFASSVNEEIVRHSPHVDAVYVWGWNVLRLVREVRRARQMDYDVVLSFVFNRTTSVALLARLAGPKALRIGHADEKYGFYFDKLVKLPRFSAHMVESLAAYVKEAFGIQLEREHLGFEIRIDSTSAVTVNEFLARHHLRRRSETFGNLVPYVVLNLSATDVDRKISVGQAKAIAETLAKRSKLETVVIHAPDDRQMKRALQKEADLQECIAYPDAGHASLLQVASLIEGTVCVMTPDTAIVHFASATRTPVLGFFTTMQGMEEWLPYGVAHALVMAEPGQPTSSIDDSKIIAAVDQFLYQLGYS